MAPLWALLLATEGGMVMLGLAILNFADARMGLRSPQYWERQRAAKVFFCGLLSGILGISALIFAGEELTRRGLLPAFLILVTLNLVLFAALRQWDRTGTALYWARRYPDDQKTRYVQRLTLKLKAAVGVICFSLTIIGGTFIYCLV